MAYIQVIDMHFKETIQKWFSEKWGESLLLPDGWYGRPHDNQHSLTSINETKDSLTLILDEKLTLHFEGLISISTHKNELILGPFKKLRFEWETYGTEIKSGVKEYLEGEAKIISAPG